MVVLTLAGFTYVEILRDPAQQTEQSSFLGFLSNIGTWLWIAGFTFCFFRIATYERPDRDEHKMLLHLAGWFALLLGVDDFFLIHDRYIAEGFLIPLYAIFIGTMLYRYTAKIIEVDGFAFLMAGGLLAGSVLVDTVQEILPIPYGVSQIAEEGFKFTGAATWAYFCFRLAAHRRV